MPDMDTIDLVINADGQISAVWNDALAGLGEARIVRASHVEPYDGSGGDAFAAKYADGGWWTADMGPSDGPVLGPFRTRGEALEAERQWLRDNRGL